MLACLLQGDLHGDVAVPLLSLKNDVNDNVNLLVKQSWRYYNSEILALLYQCLEICMDQGAPWPTLANTSSTKRCCLCTMNMKMMDNRISLATKIE